MAAEPIRLHRPIKLATPATTAAPATPPLLLTIDQAAELLNLSPRTLRRLTAAGRIRCRKIGSSTRYLVADLQEFAIGLPQGGGQAS